MCVCVNVELVLAGRTEILPLLSLGQTSRELRVGIPELIKTVCPPISNSDRTLFKQSIRDTRIVCVCVCACVCVVFEGECLYVCVYVCVCVVEEGVRLRCECCVCVCVQIYLCVCVTLPSLSPQFTRTSKLRNATNKNDKTAKNPQLNVTQKQPCFPVENRRYFASQASFWFSVVGV